jgi:hypothetical protein
MADIKRAKYFDQQLLLLKDFTDEQFYHLHMRRRHNQLLHTTGVADGLKVVKTGAKQVTVNPGMALDNEGREIVLDKEIPIDLSDAELYPPNFSYLVTISYAESETDLSASGDKQNTRIQESYRASVIREGRTSPDGAAVQLARLTFSSKGVVNDPDLSVRKLAGASAFDKPDADLTVHSLRLSTADPSSANWPRLTANDSNQLIIGGPLVAQGPITINSDLSANNATIRSRLSVTGPIVPSVGNTPGTGIQFPSDPGGGSGDEAYIRYSVVSGETAKLQIGIGNDADDSISLVQYGLERLTITGGNIGIGTPAPDAPLRVKQSVGALAFKVTANSTGPTEPIAEFRHDNGFQGVGIGYASIYATGSNLNQDLSIFAHGSGTLFLNRDSGGQVILGTSLHVNGPITSTMWSVRQLINSQPGPMTDLSAQFSTGGGTLIIFAAGSGWTQIPGTIGMTVFIDGLDKGSALCWTNETNPALHRAFTANAIVVTGISGGSHTLKLVPIGATLSDNHDYFSVTALELPF